MTMHSVLALERSNIAAERPHRKKSDKIESRRKKKKLYKPEIESCLGADGCRLKEHGTDKTRGEANERAGEKKREGNVGQSKDDLFGGIKREISPPRPPEQSLLVRKQYCSQQKKEDIFLFCAVSFIAHTLGVKRWKLGRKNNI